MGKRTSDFLALAAILSGAGVGLGLTSLRAENRPDTVRDRDESSVRVEVRRGMRVEPGQIIVSTSPRGSIVYMLRRERENVEVHRQRLQRIRVDVESLQRGQLLELRSQLRGLGDSEALAELLEAVESLEDLDLGESLTIDVSQDEEDQRRKRRRRRRPRRIADVPNSAGSGN